MDCPACGHAKSKVLFSRHDSIESMVRGRECLICEHCWYTLEVEIPRKAFKYVNLEDGLRSTPTRIGKYKIVRFGNA